VGGAQRVVHDEDAAAQQDVSLVDQAQTLRQPGTQAPSPATW
jgi:hypothetical protein